MEFAPAGYFASFQATLLLVEQQSLANLQSFMKRSLLKTTRLFTFCLSFLLIQSIDVKADITLDGNAKRDSAKASRAGRNWKMLMDNPLFIGLEFSTPPMRYGFKAKQPWFGPSVMGLSGLFHANFQRGLAETNDSGKVYQAAGWSSQIGFRIPVYTAMNRNFQFIPNLGFGITLHGLDDRRKTASDKDGGDAVNMGFCLSPGIIFKAGPVVATINYTATIGYNFTSRNAFDFFNHYPSVGIYMTTLPMLMNPQDFSASGLRHYKDLVGIELINSGLTVDRKIAEDQNSITYRREQIKWVKSTYADRYEQESVTCRDVRPFTYIGPRMVSTWFTGKQMQQSVNLGVNMGFRYGMWWFNTFAESGSVMVKSPATPDEMFKYYQSASFPDLSGQYRNTMKFGGQIGIELISRAMKSDFKPYSYQQAKEIKSVTSFVGIIPYVGYGVSKMGTYSYNSPGGAADLEEYNTKAFNQTTFDPNSISGNQVFFNFGGCFHFGATVVGMDWNIYPNAKKLNSRQIYLGLNLPVARIVRSLTVRSYVKKIQRMNVK